MTAKTVWISLTSLSLLPACRGSSPASPVLCQTQEAACHLDGHNILATHVGLPRLEQCRQLCNEEEKCKFLSHIPAEGLTRDICILFSSCRELTGRQCAHCITETSTCARRCDGKYEVSVTKQNLIAAVSNVASVSDCRELCDSRSGCKFYSYHHKTGKVLYKMCFLLSHQLKPYQNSEDVTTGPINCEKSRCMIRFEGELHRSVLFSLRNVSNKVQKSYKAQLIGGETDGNCHMRILAVGGGGRGSQDWWTEGKQGSCGFGGGSGHLQFLAQGVPPLVSDIEIHVGAGGEMTRVFFKDQELLEPSAGGSGNGYQAGAGYSGGGGGKKEGRWCGPCRGGSDGSEGENGGSGSGKEISTFPFENFSLLPGAGGYRSCGGGGGGVLVNGVGPRREHEGQGEGYGGGGEGCPDCTSRDGLPGAVILELANT